VRRRVFQSEVKVALLLIAGGAIGMPAVVWLLGHRGTLLEFYGATFLELVTFGHDWFAIVIATLVPVFLFQVACTIVWALEIDGASGRRRSQPANRKKAPNKAPEPTTFAVTSRAT
jgi:hypothetical protein